MERDGIKIMEVGNLLVLVDSTTTCMVKESNFNLVLYNC